MHTSPAWLRYAHSLARTSTRLISSAPRPHSVSRVTFPRNSPSNPGPGAPKTSQVPRMEMSTSATATQARFSAGSDEVALGPKLQSLLAPAGGRWNLISSGEGLERSFKFKTFAKTWVSYLRPMSIIQASSGCDIPAQEGGGGRASIPAPPPLHS